MAVPAFVRPGDRLIWIGGRHVPGSSGETPTNVGPTTEAELASIQRGTAEDVDAAVQAARRAFTDPCWSGAGSDRRGRNLPQIADMGVIPAAGVTRGYAPIRGRGPGR
ncbi:aldehyde dehydrogenase family protein [Nonomuraea sp. NPDC049421]|uniref:aldehyde dehydrogenase family protein n=1 Tax=Nonomuraea sp. NPDC049421 TaxID=3155275 RepID=UPI00342F4ACB